MSFSVEIHPCQTREVYGVDSIYGYKINSKAPINSEETIKIQEILNSFLELTIAKGNMVIMEEKFKNYVSWQLKGGLENITEHQLYKTALEKLEKAKEDLYNIKIKYQVTVITPFSNS